MRKNLNSLLNEVQLVYSSSKNLIARQKINSSNDAFRQLSRVFRKDTVACQEEFIVMLLNQGNYPIGYYRASIGGISSTVADVRLILSVALKSLASGIILCHNHPSGELRPSESDKILTKKIRLSCELLDISLLDHLIVSPFDQYYSFADDGILNF